MSTQFVPGHGTAAIWINPFVLAGGVRLPTGAIHRLINVSITGAALVLCDHVICIWFVEIPTATRLTGALGFSGAGGGAGCTEAPLKFDGGLSPATAQPAKASNAS